jgi:hypothetical protein
MNTHSAQKITGTILSGFDCRMITGMDRFVQEGRV